MKVTVIGGTGLIGSKLVNKLLGLDHTVVAASRTSGINTVTGEGLNAALQRADVVVDVSNAPSFEDNAAMDFFRISTMNLVTASLYARVKHYIAISIVGSERLPDSGYLRAKLAQEELIKESGISYSILRSTQFFEYAGRIAEASSVGEEVRISPAAFQPIAADEAVATLTDIALGTPLNASVEVAGPVRMRLYDFIRYYLDTTEDPRRLIMDEHALYFGAELTDESLVPGENSRLGKLKYEDWLNRQLVFY